MYFSHIFLLAGTKIYYGSLFRMTSFEEILNYFKLMNGWLNSKLCAKRKLLRLDENAYVFFVKKEILKFVIEL